jgi:cell pole-organizing protein PopZ
MANEAHREPTMEEILASIRKIIADDTPQEGAPAPSREKAEASPHRGFVFQGNSDAGMFEGDPEGDAGRSEQIISGPEFSFEEMLGATRTAPEPVRAQAPAEVPVQKIRNSPAPQTSPEISMAASPRHFHAPLTDENTADAAAGALGKLISRMDISGGNTLEGLVRELLKPMIKEWLDANLARIVEEKVEAEVERIARMVR